MLSLPDDIKPEKGRDYQKLFKIITLGAAIGLILVLILGWVFDFIFYSVLLYLTGLVSVIGYFGGVWLWEYLASSELLTEEMKSLIKKVGWGALVVFIIIIGSTLFLSFSAQTELLISIVNWVNILLLFMLAYNIGYLVSIWRKPLKTEGDEGIALEEGVKIDWGIAKAVFKVALPSFSTIIGATLIVGITQGQINTMFLAIGFQILLFFGFCLGYIIWEHLKRTNLISGRFLAQLKWVSLIFLIASGGLTLYGIITVSTEVIIIQILRELMLYYAVFLVCLFFYFLGLFISILKSK